MTRPCYFVVQRIMGLEMATLYWDEPPRSPIHNLVYIVRLDTLPNGHALVDAGLTKLFSVYQRLKASGKLPPRWEPPKRPPADKARVLVGHRESPRAVIERSRAKPK